MLSGAGIISVQIGDRQVTYGKGDVEGILNQLNRDIAAFERRASNVNPEIRTPKWS